MNPVATENMASAFSLDFASLLAIAAPVVVFALAAWLTVKLARFVFEGFAIALTIGILVATFGPDAMPEAMRPVLEFMRPMVENAKPVLENIVLALETVLS